MTNDRYLRWVLTTIALALVYLCVVLTPLPIASAQGARTPGESTGPAEMVIVGVRLGPADAIPVYAPNPIPLTGDVKVSNEVRVTGRVQTEQAAQTSSRVVIAGWEEKGGREAAGAYLPVDSSQGRGLPTAPVR
jgi:hypothetical protein